MYFKIGPSIYNQGIVAYRSSNQVSYIGMRSILDTVVQYLSNPWNNIDIFNKLGMHRITINTISRTEMNT